jgi:hypothetical protein
VRAQATGDLDNDSENIASIIYSMLQDANTLLDAHVADTHSFQRLSGPMHPRM